MNIFGVDVARSGEDQSVCYIRNGHEFVHMEVWAKADTMESAGKVEQLYNRYGAEAIIVDCDGVGAGVFDRLRENKLPVFAFHGSSRCEKRDRTGELGFRNLRSYAIWHLRELMEPTFGVPIEIPRNEQLIEELAVAKYETRSGALIEIGSKDEIKKRIKRSPDLADAMAYAYSDIHLSDFESSYAAMAALNLAREERPQRDQRPAVEVFMTEKQQEDRLFGGAHRNCDLFELTDF
jgi:phage terminase large subunit